MNPLEKEKRSLTPEQIIEDFDRKGIVLSIKDAEKYLDMLYLLAKLIVEQNFL